MLKVFDSMFLSVSSERVLAQLGKRKNARITAEFSKLFESSFASAVKLQEIKGVWRKMKIDRRAEDFLLLGAQPETGCEDDSLEINSGSVYRWMEGCGLVYAMALTVGEPLNGKIQELTASGDSAAALIHDAVGSELVEEAANILTRNIGREADRPITKRYSPGYGDWGIENQAGMDKILNLGRIGIRLNESYLMLPEKSITAIIGVKDGGK
jgi:hypothetical protein